MVLRICSHAFAGAPLYLPAGVSVGVCTMRPRGAARFLIAPYQANQLTVEVGAVSALAAAHKGTVEATKADMEPGFTVAQREWIDILTAAFVQPAPARPSARVSLSTHHAMRCHSIAQVFMRPPPGCVSVRSAL